MYGENTRLLRDSLRELLTQHRIQQRIGGAGLHTVSATTTVTERQEIGEQIARYRHAVLVWCHQALRATNPRINLAGTSARSRGPAEELRFRLDAAINADPAGLPTMDELVTGQRFEMVDLWRHAARACALGEHDFDAGVGYGRLSEAQCLRVIQDAAEIARALVGLDRRYSNIPGWKQLKDPGRLGRAAEVCAAYSGYGAPDYSVDRRGWKPPARLIDGPGLPGITGVLQAQHNLLLHLIKFPDAQSLRVVMDSQRIVSLEAAQHLNESSPEFAARWQRRAGTYGHLVHATRDVGGLYGKGGLAAGQGAVAAARMQKLSDDAMNDPTQVRRLMHISAGIDERVCTAVELGIKERLYFHRVIVPAVENDGHLVRGPRREWLPVTGPVQTELLDTVRNELRPAPVEHKPPKGAAQNRLDFEAAINHRPGDPGLSRST